MTHADQNGTSRLRVLFLCTGNSCRSQMAEGWARALKGDALDAYSAGTAPQALNPLAVRAMREAGVDISRNRSKRPDELGLSFDVIVTVCDSAREACPMLPGVRLVHVGFEDPPRLARDAKSDDEAMPHYRRVRDEIRAFVETLPGALFDSHHSEAPLPGSSADACCEPGCCGGTKGGSAPPPELVAGADEVREKVREGYAKIAQSGVWSPADAGSPTTGGACGTGGAGGGCCGPATFTPEQLAAALGYAPTDLAGTPSDANLGLSCGNPTALAALIPGETVLDLGAGGGFDAFIAGRKVGAAGRVIGVDMTPDMVSRARRNTGAYAAQTGLSNVEFRLGEIEHLPVADASVDVVLSNCVLNLSPDKARVWREIARVLKPGGRVAVSDIALFRPLPEAVLQDVEALVGCVAGAVLVNDVRDYAMAAGLVDVVLTPKPQYIDALVGSEDPLYQKVVAMLPTGTKPSDFITSLDIAARKGGRTPA